MGYLVRVDHGTLTLHGERTLNLIPKNKSCISQITPFQIYLCERCTWNCTTKRPVLFLKDKQETLQKQANQQGKRSNHTKGIQYV